MLLLCWEMLLRVCLAGSGPGHCGRGIKKQRRCRSLCVPHWQLLCVLWILPLVQSNSASPSHGADLTRRPGRQLSRLDLEVCSHRTSLWFGRGDGRAPSLCHPPPPALLLMCPSLTEHCRNWPAAAGKPGLSANSQSKGARGGGKEREREREKERVWERQRERWEKRWKVNDVKRKNYKKNDKARDGTDVEWIGE